jgi:hypothetical protein
VIPSSTTASQLLHQRLSCSSAGYVARLDRCHLQVRARRRQPRTCRCKCGERAIRIGVATESLASRMNEAVIEELAATDETVMV